MLPVPADLLAKIMYLYVTVQEFPAKIGNINQNWK